MRNRMMVGLCLLGLTIGLLGGCGESAELKLQRAQIALSSGKPDQALQMAESVLKEKPSDPLAMEYKARAQLQLLRLGDSRKTIDALLKAQPDSVAARRLMADWTFRQMGHLLGQSDFLTNPQVQTQFDDALATGLQQADWMEKHDKGSVTALYLRARYADTDYIRTDALLKKAQTKLDQAKIDGGPDLDDFRDTGII